MKIIKDIPNWLCGMIVSEPHEQNPNRMGVTDLIKTPRQRTLKIEKYEDIEVNASDHLNFFSGNNLDEAFEKQFGPQKKLEIEIDGFTLVGKPDLIGSQILFYYPDENIDPNDIFDCKNYKVYATKYADTMWECEAQLNIYDYMRNILFGKRAKTLANLIFYKNHSKEKIGGDYPKIAFELVKQKQWSLEDQEKYIKERIQYHKEKPYDCPEDQRWSSFAVKTKGKQRAERVLESREECEQWIKENGRGDYIEDRGGRKCKFYCPVRSVCELAKGDKK